VKVEDNVFPKELPKFVFPCTERVSLGLLVPIPTLPPEVIRIRSVGETAELAVLNVKNPFEIPIADVAYKALSTTDPFQLNDSIEASPLVGTVNLCLALFHPDGVKETPNAVDVLPTKLNLSVGELVPNPRFPEESRRIRSALAVSNAKFPLGAETATLLVSACSKIF
jgi:hypothetical protein